MRRIYKMPLFGAAGLALAAAGAFSIVFLARLGNDNPGVSYKPIAGCERWHLCSVESMLTSYMPLASMALIAIALLLSIAIAVYVVLKLRHGADQRALLKNSQDNNSQLHAILEILSFHIRNDPLTKPAQECFTPPSAFLEIVEDMMIQNQKLRDSGADNGLHIERVKAVVAEYRAKLDGLSEAGRNAVEDSFVKLADVLCTVIDSLRDRIKNSTVEWQRQQEEIAALTTVRDDLNKRLEEQIKLVAAKQSEVDRLSERLRKSTGLNDRPQLQPSPEIDHLNDDAIIRDIVALSARGDETKAREDMAFLRGAVVGQTPAKLIELLFRDESHGLGVLAQRSDTAGGAWISTCANADQLKALLDTLAVRYQYRLIWPSPKDRFDGTRHQLYADPREGSNAQRLIKRLVRPGLETADGQKVICPAIVDT